MRCYKTVISKSDASLFDVRNQCFICAKNTKGGENLTQITSGTGDSTREKIVAAAEDRQDNAVHCRMLAHLNLFSFVVQVKYHRSCYSQYISKRNITCAQMIAKDPF